MAVVVTAVQPKEKGKRKSGKLEYGLAIRLLTIPLGSLTITFTKVGVSLTPLMHSLKLISNTKMRLKNCAKHWLQATFLNLQSQQGVEVG
jgi:uncharacterized membrane protein